MFTCEVELPKASMKKVERRSYYQNGRVGVEPDEYNTGAPAAPQTGQTE